ncbi:hypothetical protein [Campylobacter sp. 19-13652]|uniref:hypothetical protein n=1 Tax=Campylobacter sp. 19-13652 TaxID=2840180 RepID=UPI001C863413|nr:hypothetical protein [Campylobacter sp. 19-13652]
MKYFFILLLAIAPLSSQNPPPISPAAKYADYYHKRLPYRIDEYTELVDLLDISNRLFYRYHINDTKRSAPSRFNNEELKQYSQKLYQSALTQVCADGEVWQMFEQGVLLWHGFYTQNGRLLFDFKISKLECEKYRK